MLRTLSSVFRSTRSTYSRRVIPLYLERSETRDLLSAVVPFKLFGTGLNDYGHPLTDGALDSHYSIITGPSTAAPVVLPQGGFPFPYWSADDRNSAWITPGDAVNNAGTGYTEPEGDYDYRTTFDLTGFDSSTASIVGQIGADNTVTQVLLNGQDVGYTPTNVGNNFSSLNTLNITGNYFTIGVNTLDFLVHNDAGDSNNPTGFRAQLSGTAALLGTPFQVFGTGVDDSSSQLDDGTVDPHYYIISAPAPYSGIGTLPDAAASAYVTQQNGYPYPDWVSDGPNSKWLSINADENDYDGGVTEPTGDFTYRTTFDLTGFDPATARIAGGFSADDSLTHVLLNGQDVGFTPDPSGGSDYTSMHPLNIGSGFVAGVNTQDFVVHNINLATHNPSAFRAQIAGAAQPVAVGPHIAVTNTPSNNNVNISQKLGSQAEESIAINPLDPNHLFATSVDVPASDLFAATLDRTGGNTAWAGRVIADGNPAFAVGNTPAGSGDSLPRADSDPSVAYDDFGNLFLTYESLRLDKDTHLAVSQVGVATAANPGVGMDPASLTDANHSWAPDEWAGATLVIQAGAGSGATQYTIYHNTENTLTITGNWANGVPGPNSQYIIELSTQRVVLAVSTDNGHSFRFLNWVAYSRTGAFQTGDVDQPTVTTGPGHVFQAAGPATGYGPDTVTDTTRNWTVNNWAGDEVAIVAGTGQGQILANTTDTLILQNDWLETPQGDSQYVIRTSAGAVWVSWGFVASDDVSVSDPRKVAVRGAGVDGLGIINQLLPAEIIGDSTKGEFADPKVGPDGQLLVAYQTYGDPSGLSFIKVALDGDGLGPDPFNIHSVSAAQTHVGTDYPLPAAGARAPDAGVTLAWDRSGLHDPGKDGRVYLIYTDVNDSRDQAGNLARPNDSYIDMKYSDDSGVTWSTDEQVNDRDGNSQFLPAAAVDQTTGYLAVAWYDARNDPNNVLAQIYGTVTDGVLNNQLGLTFLKDVKIGALASNAAASGDQFGFGDYTGLAFYGGTFFPAWADNANVLGAGDNPGPRTAPNPSGPMDVYTAPVVVTLIQPPPQGQAVGAGPLPDAAASPAAQTAGTGPLPDAAAASSPLTESPAVNSPTAPDSAPSPSAPTIAQAFGAAQATSTLAGDLWAFLTLPAVGSSSQPDQTTQAATLAPPQPQPLSSATQIAVPAAPLLRPGQLLALQSLSSDFDPRIDPLLCSPDLAGLEESSVGDFSWRPAEGGSAA